MGHGASEYFRDSRCVLQANLPGFAKRDIARGNINLIWL